MQPLQNSDLRRIPTERNKGIIGTIIIHAVVLGSLLMFSFSVPPIPKQEEGILVNFGTDETGLGMIEPSAPAMAETAATPVETSQVISEDEPLLTQDDEDAPEVKKVDPEAERKKLEKIEADRILREQIEAERVKKAQEEIERKRIEAEQQRQSDIMALTKNALAGSKNSGTNSTSEGIAGGTGNQGSTTGSPDSQNRGEGSGTGDSGVSYVLGDRRVQKLPLPKYDSQEEGTVVVEIWVDRAGKVTQANPGVKGSNILNEYLLRVAKEAALEARFDPKPDAQVIQKGTIIYNFKLR